MPTEILTPADFNAALAEAGSKLVVVDFYADWCGPCKMIAPKVAEMEKEFSDVVFLKVNVDENDATAEEYGIQAMPTFMFFRDGKKIDSFSGANEQKLRVKIKAMK